MIQRISSTATAAFSPGSRFPPVCSRKRMSTGAPSASPQRRRVLRPVQAERSQRRTLRERKKLARLRKSVPRPKQNPRSRSKRPRARRHARKVRRKRRPVDRQRVRSRKGDAQIVCNHRPAFPVAAGIHFVTSVPAQALPHGPADRQHHVTCSPRWTTSPLRQSLSFWYTQVFGSDNQPVPSEPYGLRAEVAHIGIERLGAGGALEHAAQHWDPTRTSAQGAGVSIQNDLAVC